MIVGDHCDVIHISMDKSTYYSMIVSFLDGVICPLEAEEDKLCLL